MAILAAERRIREEYWKRHLFPLLANAPKVWKGGMACLDSVDGTVKSGQASTTLLHIGTFAETVDNSAIAAVGTVNVDLDIAITVRWWDNDAGGTPIVAANVGGDAYILDDHTVTAVSAAHSKAGRIWAVDPVKGVAVQAFAHGV